MMSALKSCPRKAQLEYVEHWRPQTPSVHLHAGKAFAAGLEEAREAFYVAGRPAGEAVALGVGRLLAEYGDFECPEDSAKSASRMAGALEYYFDQYPLGNDGCTPITLPGGKHGIEINFVEPLPIAHPQTGEPLLYSGRLDMACHFAGGLYVEDDKTTSSLGATWSRQWDLRCFDEETELLTDTGWKKIPLIKEGESVMQWANGTLSFTSANDVHTSDYTGDMILIQGTRINQCVTPNHRIPLNLRRGGFRTVFANDLFQQDGHHSIPLNGKHQSECLPPLVQMYIAALQADGCLRNSAGKPNYIGRGHREHMPFPAASFTFTKPRKKERLKWILDSLQVNYTESENDFYISGFEEIQEIAMKLLSPEKVFLPGTEGLYDSTFIEELQYWDGWKNQYYTTIKENANFVQTVGHMQGYLVSVKQKITHTVSYVVCISTVEEVSLESVQLTRIPSTGKVYCLSVPSGFLLTKRKGKISISGNSQFTAYCWGLERVAGITPTGCLVRGVSILKTKYETQQAVTYRPKWLIDRWLEITLMYLRIAVAQWEADPEGWWLQNFDHACAEFGGCIFRQVCSSPDPERWLEGYFERRKWNPITREEILL
jgi:hypothetical protein